MSATCSCLSPYIDGFRSSSSSSHRHFSFYDCKKLKPSRFYPQATSLGPTGENRVVTLLDYGAGNVRSVRNAVRYLGFRIKDVETPEDILQASRLIFPGVGAFASAMDVLKKKGFSDALRAYIEKDRPFFGICLGMQLLFDSSEEDGSVEGLGLIPGTVSRFDHLNALRVPHIGWNALHITKDPGLFEEMSNGRVYFVHSYRVLPSTTNEDWISSLCDYGGNFIASISKGNVHAVQFHPEKSGDVGLSVLKRFLISSLPIKKMANRIAKASGLAKRVIACLDVRTNDKGNLVVTKGDQYDVREETTSNMVRDLGNPVELASQYYRDGADEISFLNITGFRDFPLGDLPMLRVLRQSAESVFVPMTVGGGIRDFVDVNGRHYSSIEIASEYFRSGADKVSIGSDAVFAAEAYMRTGLKTGKSSTEQIARVYGNQAVVVSIDPRRVYVSHPDDVEFKAISVARPGPRGEKYAWYQCTVNGGRLGRPIGAYECARAVEALGAGEILLNCIDFDGPFLSLPFSLLESVSGQGKGYDMELINMVADAVRIPVIASSGAGSVHHFSEVFLRTDVSAALAAGIFHRKQITIPEVKQHLCDTGIEVRV